MQAQMSRQPATPPATAPKGKTVCRSDSEMELLEWFRESRRPSSAKARPTEADRESPKPAQAGARDSLSSGDAVAPRVKQELVERFGSLEEAVVVLKRTNTSRLIVKQDFSRVMRQTLGLDFLTEADCSALFAFLGRNSSGSPAMVDLRALDPGQQPVASPRPDAQATVNGAGKDPSQADVQSAPAAPPLTTVPAGSGRQSSRFLVTPRRTVAVAPPTTLGRAVSARCSPDWESIPGEPRPVEMAPPDDRRARCGSPVVPRQIQQVAPVLVSQPLRPAGTVSSPRLVACTPRQHIHGMQPSYSAVLSARQSATWASPQMTMGRTTVTGQPFHPFAMQRSAEPNGNRHAPTGSALFVSGDPYLGSGSASVPVPVDLGGEGGRGPAIRSPAPPRPIATPERFSRE
mmetsp:Transcript_4836/g.11824  ORF Transcript_4836/g.11824 Transcript_4836/m.11824 type:complete len:403 (+) Transcript_4836:336-1544(+)